MTQIDQNPSCDLENNNSPSQPHLAVSVIIPMYNVEKYIGDCLESVLNQTLQDFEVILINDCSTDGSRTIAESYLEKFGGRLKILDNEKNFGPSTSRNNGLRIATGEYVFFMDSDDVLLSNGLEEMYSFSKKSDADFISFKIRCNMDEGGTKLIIKERKQPILPENTVLIDYPERLEVVDIEDLQTVRKRVSLKGRAFSWRMNTLLLPVTFPWEVWLKFLKRNFLIENELFFNENIYLAEDHVWTYGIFLCAKKVVHIPRILYHHRSSKGSIVRTKRNDFQNINLWVNTLFHGIKWVNTVMGKIDVFNQNPKFRYSVLENFSRRYFQLMLKYTLKHSPHDIYGSIKQEFGDAWGNNDVLIAQLITYVDTLKKRYAELEEQFKISQQRIAEFESQIASAQ